MHSIRLTKPNRSLSCTKTLYDQVHELRDAYGRARRAFDSYQEDSTSFAEELYKALVEFLKAPPEAISLYRINPKGGFEIANPPFNHVMVLRDDGFWEFGVGVTVHDGDNTYPRDVSFIRFLVRKNLNGQYQVRAEGTKGCLL